MTCILLEIWVMTWSLFQVTPLIFDSGGAVLLVAGLEAVAMIGRTVERVMYNALSVLAAATYEQYQHPQSWLSVL
jgi:hypothetical protein